MWIVPSRMMYMNVMKLIIGSVRTNVATTATVLYSCNSLFFRRFCTEHLESSNFTSDVDVSKQHTDRWSANPKPGDSWTRKTVKSHNSRKTIESSNFNGTLRQIKNSTYVTSQEIGDAIASLISSDLLKNGTFVAEVNPGNGYLTTALLNAGIPSIRLYEPNKFYYERLQNLCNKFPKRLDIRPYSIYNISSLEFTDYFSKKNVSKELLEGIEKREWKDKPCVQIVGIMKSAYDIHRIMMAIVNENSLIKLGRPEIYVAVPSSLLKVLTVPKQMKKSSWVILFNILFNCKEYGIIPRQKLASLPVPKYLKKDFVLHVIKIEAKPDLFTNYLSKEDLRLFWIFIRHIAAKKSRYIIPELEKIVPGCGIKLIEKDCTVFMKFCDLTPAQCLALFKEMNSWPDFSKSQILSIDSSLCF